MSDVSDTAYFARRRRECLEKAKAAIDPGIARTHFAFAQHYARAIGEAETSPITGPRGRHLSGFARFGRDLVRQGN